jgi:UV DNA damage endonuclease
MGLPKDYRSPINIHIGGSYGDKESALTRFCENFKRLAPHTQARLVVENDDKASQYSVKDLYDGVYKVVGCPITFDHLHHRFCTGGLLTLLLLLGMDSLRYNTTQAQRPSTKILQ